MPVVEGVQHLRHEVEEQEVSVLGFRVDGFGAGDIGCAEGIPIDAFLLDKAVFLVNNLP